MASASALVRAFLILAEAPDMVLMLMPVYWLDVTSPEASSVLSIVKETQLLYSSDDVIKPRFGIYDLINTQSDWLLWSCDWLPRKQQCHLSGFLSFSRAF